MNQSPDPLNRPANQYASPENSTSPFWKETDPVSICDSPAELLRFSRAEVESNLRALGIVCYCLGIYWILGSFQYLRLMFLDIQGSISAPWVGEPFYLVSNGLGLILAIMAFVAGFSLRQLDEALRWGFAFTATYVLYWCLLWGNSLWKGNVWDALATFVVGTFVLIPMSLLLRSRNAAVLGAEHRAVIEQTPYIKIRGRLPLAITLGMWLALALGIGLSLASKVF